MDTLKRLLRRDAVPSIKKILFRTHPADVAQVLDGFLPQEKLRILSYVGDVERQAEVIACLRVPQAVEILSALPSALARHLPT